LIIQLNNMSKELSQEEVEAIFENADLIVQKRIRSFDRAVKFGFIASALIILCALAVSIFKLTDYL